MLLLSFSLSFTFKLLKSFENMMLPHKPQILNVCKTNNMIISFKFYTFSISDDQFFWRYSESKTDQSYPVKWGNFDRTWSNFDRTWSNFNCTWGNFDRPIKVTPRVNKVVIIIVNKNKLSFLWRVLWKEKHVGECVNKKTKYFYVYIFNISNFDRDFGVALMAPTVQLWSIFWNLKNFCFFKIKIFKLTILNQLDILYLDNVTFHEV